MLRSPTNLAAFLKLPVECLLVENGTAPPRTKLYIPYYSVMKGQ